MDEMTSDEIRSNQIEVSDIARGSGDEPGWSIAHALYEVAYQLAVMNERADAERAEATLKQTLHDQMRTFPPNLK